MNKKIVWLVVSCLMVLGLLAASCAKAEEKAPAAKEAAPVVKEAAPAVKEAAPVVKEAAPAAGAEMVTVRWKKGDGTLVEKQMEKPRYGGTASYSRATSIPAWDEAYNTPWGIKAYLHTNEKLIQGEWPRGPACTGEVNWVIGGWMRADYSYGELAESWEFPDTETAIFHIRKGVRYALDPNSAASRLVNGREFTADDVVFNIKRIYFEIKTSTMYGMAGDASRPTDVYAKDKYTVVVKSPPGQIGKTWEYVADWSFMVPPEVVKKYGDMNQWENVVGTGPFILTDYVPMSAATFTRNPNYWMKDPLIPENQLPYLNGLKMYIIPDISTTNAAIRTGKIDWLHQWEREDALPIIERTPAIQWYGWPQDSFMSIGWRMDKQELPFKDIRVRRALHLGINQQEIVDTYYGGKGSILNFKVINAPMFKDVHTPVEKLPLSADGFDNKKLYGYYPEEAKKLLAEAGYPNGFGFSVDIYNIPTSIDHLLMAKNYLAKIGVDLKLNVLEYGAWNTLFQRKTFSESIWCGRWGGEPYTFFMVRKGSMWNWGYVDNPIFDAYYDKMTALYFQPEERNKVMKEANLAAIDYVPYYTFPVGYRYNMWWPWVKNFDGIYSLGLGGYFFQKYMWIDQELKKSMGY